MKLFNIISDHDRQNEKIKNKIVLHSVTQVYFLFMLFTCHFGQTTLYMFIDAKIGGAGGLLG